MHILQPFCIPMFSVLFRHNKTPKVFCLTFGVHVKSAPVFLFLIHLTSQTYWVQEVLRLNS